MPVTDQKIKEILLAENYVSAEDIKMAEKYAVLHRTPITEDLYARGIITKDILGQAIAEYYRVPYADLNSYPVNKEQVLRIPEEVGRKFHVVLFRVEKKGLIFTTDNPDEKTLPAELAKIAKGEKFKICYSLTEDIDNALVSYRQELTLRFTEIIKKEKRIAPQIFDEILLDALTVRASDVHLEPQEAEVVVRFRVDGVLHEVGRIPKQFYENILNRIKVQANLRIDEHYAAQDGSIRWSNEKEKVEADLRVSVMPTLDGEKVVARILARYVQGFSLSDLGFSSRHQDWIVKAAKKPFGMIIVAGPTGSGKSTTLYALLKYVNNSELNITTIEDPVEYKISGVNQVQVNPRTNLTFAKGLRSIVRQDPDIILVGEIRDQETAEIAVNAALTGHLLLSTFHANDAATAVPRLLDMGVEPFLLSSTLELVISQRLVRRVCEHCRHSVKIDLGKLEKKFKGAGQYFSRGATLYEGAGCDVCGHTGYKGRVAIFEFIYVNSDMKDLILKNPSSREIWTLAKEMGSASLFEDGIEKVKNGVTTIDELLRVAAPPEISVIKNYATKK